MPRFLHSIHILIISGPHQSWSRFGYIAHYSHFVWSGHRTRHGSPWAGFDDSRPARKFRRPRRYEQRWWWQHETVRFLWRIFCQIFWRIFLTNFRQIFDELYDDFFDEFWRFFLAIFLANFLMNFLTIFFPNFDFSDFFEDFSLTFALQALGSLVPSILFYSIIKKFVKLQCETWIILYQKLFDVQTVVTSCC